MLSWQWWFFFAATFLNRMYFRSVHLITTSCTWALKIREEPPPYSSPTHQRYESFENPLAGPGSQSFGSHDDERLSSTNRQHGTALYDFTAGGDDEVCSVVL